MKSNGMKRILAVLVVQAALVAGFAFGLRRGDFPLGIPGEWTWSRLPEDVGPIWVDWVLGVFVVVGYTVFVTLGWRLLIRPGAGWFREVVLVSALAITAVAAQVGMQAAAPAGYGLTKWTFAQHSPGSNGYFTIAREAMPDPGRFWADYPDWIVEQDALHVGTHPPGLFLGWRAILGFYQDQPELARAVVAALPNSVTAGFREIARYDPLPPAERAAMATVGFLTLLACSLTVIPLYGLVRIRSGATTAWAAAALWPLVPAALLFQPASDAAFPLLSTTAIVLAATNRRIGAGLAGVVLAIGMQLTLAFLAVGLVVGLILLSEPGVSWRQRCLRVALTGAGFAALTCGLWAFSGANPLMVWWWNSRNHARFYEEFPRSYLAWNLVNPLELAVALGLPVAIWSLIGLRSPDRTTWATLAVLLLLQLSGRNLSEVARLWLPLMPPLVAAAGRGIEQQGGRSTPLAATLLLLGAQSLALQATIQVVYAVG